MEERKFEYSDKLVLCKYFPSTSAKNDHRVKYYLRNMNLGDVDSLILKDGRIQEMIEIRQGDAYPPTGHYQYKYSSSNDLLEIKRTFSKNDTASRKFQYKDKKLTKIIENQRALKAEFLISRENEKLDPVNVFYTQDNVARKALSYIFVYNNDILTRVYETSPYGGSDSWTFEFDPFGNLIMLSTRSDTGTSGFRYEYEPGKGNVILFQKREKLMSSFFHQFNNVLLLP